MNEFYSCSKCRRRDRGISPRAGVHCKKGYCKCVPVERTKKEVRGVKMAKNIEKEEEE